MSHAERYCHDLEEMTSNIGAESEDALAVEAARTEYVSCQFTVRVSSANRDGLNEILGLALSEEFRKYCFSHINLFLCKASF